MPDLVGNHIVGFPTAQMLKVSMIMVLNRFNHCKIVFEHLRISFNAGNTPVYEPRHEKTNLQGFQPGSTQTSLCSYRRRLDA